VPRRRDPEPVIPPEWRGASPEQLLGERLRLIACRRSRSGTWLYRLLSWLLDWVERRLRRRARMRRHVRSPAAQMGTPTPRVPPGTRVLVGQARGRECWAVVMPRSPRRGGTQRY